MKRHPHIVITLLHKFASYGYRKSSDKSNNHDHMSDVYADMDKYPEKYNHQGNWKLIPKPYVKKSLPFRTITFLKTLYKDLWNATDNQCGAAGGCQHHEEIPPRMYQCVICREWFHLKCVKDRRAFQATDSRPYFCPQEEHQGT